MKKILTLTIIALLLVSCSKNIFDIEEEGTLHTLKLNTIALNGTPHYPIDLYAYSGETEMGHITINSSSDDIIFELQSGTYTVYAVSGNVDFSKGYSTEPLMTGNTTVTLGSTDANATLKLDYAVARLVVSLSDIPETATGVDIKVGELYNSINVKGKTSGSTTAELACHKDKALWVTDTVYVLPSCQNSVSFTIEHSSESNSSVVNRFVYTYPNAILAGSPYNFKGSYTSGISYAKLAMDLVMGEWGEEITQNFDFGEGADKPVVSDVSEFYVDELPSTCYVWTDSYEDKHVVATIDEEGNALLFSLKEWSDVTPEGDISFVDTYTENSVAGWTIPTEEQASSLIELCRSSYSTLNTAIANAGGQELQSKDSRRFLCENLSRWYDLYIKTKGYSSNTSYYLRLVKAVRFIKK